MPATLTISTVWLAAMIAAAAFSARPGASSRQLAGSVIGFAAAFGLAVLVDPRPNWVGLAVAIMAGWRLIERRWPGLDRVLAGICAGLAGALHVGMAVQMWLALAVAALVFAAIMIVTAKGLREREFALAAVALVAPIAGFIPDVAAGWKSAQVLTQSAQATSNPAVVPAWALGFVALALAAGAIRGLLIRK